MLKFAFIVVLIAAGVSRGQSADDRVRELEARIASMEKRIDAMAQQINELSRLLANEPPQAVKQEPGKKIDKPGAYRDENIIGMTIEEAMAYGHGHDKPYLIDANQFGSRYRITLYPPAEKPYYVQMIVTVEGNVIKGFTKEKTVVMPATPVLIGPGSETPMGKKHSR